MRVRALLCPVPIIYKAQIIWSQGLAGKHSSAGLTFVSGPEECPACLTETHTLPNEFTNSV